MPLAITDPSDSRLADYVSLTDVALRRRTEPERGLYIAESEKVIRRALRAGHRPRSYLMAERWLTDLADLVADAEADGVPVFVGEHDVIEQLTGFHLHRGALASMQRPELPSVAALVADARRVLVLEDIVDHTNVGAVFRSAAALGVDAVLVTPRCADPLYRRAIRVSMGTVFQVPWTRLGLVAEDDPQRVVGVVGAFRRGQDVRERLAHVVGVRRAVPPHVGEEARGAEPPGQRDGGAGGERRAQPAMIALEWNIGIDR